MSAVLDNLNTFLIRKRAMQLKNLRALTMSQLYPTLSMSGSLAIQTQGRNDGSITTTLTPDPLAELRDPLVTLANTFSRYAQTQKTYADDLGSTRTSNAGSANVLERQVSRAIAQVLGRAPGNSPEGFVRTINDVFPTQKDGKVSLTPSRSAVSLYGQSDASQNGYTSSATSGAMSAGLIGQLSAEQATLYRQASIIAADALKVLQGLQSFVPEAEADKVEALKALVGDEINRLVEEFGRVDEPRSQRVETYFNQLRGPNGHLPQLGDRAFLNRRRVVPTTLDDEAQIAGYDLLVNYVRILREVWDNYRGKSQSSKSLRYPEFSLRLSRASVLLPVITEGNNNFMSALDSIGFTETERRSSASRFTSLGDDPNLPLPDLTLNDFTEWVDRFSSLEGPQYLADSGQYGLEFVTAQADSIFWVLLPILSFTKTVPTLNLNGLPIVAQALTHERVSWALDDLMNQLKALADLAA
jgi:hypothetical protein